MTRRVVVVSDSHFSPRTPEAERNWDAVVRHVETVAPDLVLHVGDVSVDGAHQPDELLLARRLLERIPGEWLVVPGNHDIGDNPADDAANDDDVTEDRLARWSETFGTDRWVTELDEWRLVGLDAQLFGSGVAGEAEQWSFLEDALRRERRTVLVSHKPLTAGTTELASAPPYRFVPPPAQERLLDLCRRGGVEVVVSGHVHQRRRLEAAGMTHLWATTTWAVLPDWLQAPVGTKRCGILELGLPSDGDVEPDWVEPAGMAQLTLGENVASPYEPAAGETAT
jgi:3',5'-cyclic AMP phosphodiesterase CpdA